MTARTILSELVLEPGTGKAIELLKGQILRIEQVEGGQCADFNCFNLHDYKEFMHCGRTRTVHGFHPTTGTFMWSAPPRERAMLYILEDTVGRNDVLFPRCSAYVYEAAYGFAVHTNCHDIQAEAQREYGLTPDDVHDSFNLFMCTGVDEDGHAFMTRQTTKAKNAGLAAQFAQIDKQYRRQKWWRLLARFRDGTLGIVGLSLYLGAIAAVIGLLFYLYMNFGTAIAQKFGLSK